MEFSIDRSTFLEGIQRTLSVVERKTTIPILSNVLIKTEGEKIKIIATDREISLIADYNAKVVTPGDITVAAKKLYEMIRELQGNTVDFRKMDNNWVNISSGKVFYKVAGISASDFPEILSDVDVDFFKIRCDVLKNMVTKVFFAISTDEMRPSLNGVYLNLENNTIEMVATDGHRLSIAKDELDGNENPSFEKSGIIIPRKGMSEIRKLIEDDEGFIEIGTQKGMCLVRRNTNILKVSLIDAEYPDYKKIIPVNKKGVEIKLKRDLLLHSLRRMSVMSNENFSGVKIKLLNNKMMLSSTNPDIGEAQDEIDVSYNGNDVEVGFNVRYLIEAIEAVKEDDILFEIGNMYEPGIIRPIENGNYVCIIMPLKI